MGIPSVRLSVCPSVLVSRPGTEPSPGEIETPGLHHDSLESLVSNEVILVPLGEEIPLERGHQRGVPPTPLRNRYFTTIGSSNVKTVADRHRLAAYHNKHC